MDKVNANYFVIKIHFILVKELQRPSLFLFSKSLPVTLININVSLDFLTIPQWFSMTGIIMEQLCVVAITFNTYFINTLSARSFTLHCVKFSTAEWVFSSPNQAFESLAEEF